MINDTFLMYYIFLFKVLNHELGVMDFIPLYATKGNNGKINLYEM